VETTLRALKGAADGNRLRILRILAEGPFNVAELTDILGVGQSTVSRHLRILSDAGLVAVRRAGTWAWYSLPAPTGGEFPGGLLRLLADEGEGSNGDAAAVERVLARRRRTTSEFFRRTAPDWDRMRETMLGPAVHLDRLLARLGAPHTAVDLGTGTGLLLERMARSAGAVIGVDASAEMLDVAGRRIEEAHLTNTELRLGTLEHLPLRDGEADAMVANMVLHHVADVPRVLREIRRGLAPGGRLLVADLEEHPDEAFWRGLGAQWPGFRRGDVRRWLEEAGFTEIGFDRADDSGPAAADRPTLFLAEAKRAAA
jgi:DNA-binding transcriptional ArsR family regulator